MKNEKEKVFQALHDLVATCNDAAEGYGKAAKGVHDHEVSDYLARISGERARFASEVSDALAKHGEQPRTDLHEGGILHQGWVDLETRIRPKDQHDILEDCIRGDSGTLKHYDHALRLELPVDARSLLEEQRAAVEEDLRSVHDLLSRHKPQHA